MDTNVIFVLLVISMLAAFAIFAIVLVLAVRMARANQAARRPRTWRRPRGGSAPAPEAKPAATPPPDRVEFAETSLPPGLSSAAYACAILHWFDAELLAVVAPTFKLRAESVYADLKNLSFVGTAPHDKRCIYPAVRERMLDHLWQSRPAQYRRHALLAARYFARVSYRDRTGKLGRGARLAARLLYRFPVTDSPWRSDQIEWLYHLAIADPARAAHGLRALLAAWTRAGYHGDVAHLLAALMEHVDAGRVSGELRAWTLYHKGHMDARHYRLREALQAFEEARQHAGSHELLMAVLSAISETYDLVNRNTRVGQRYDEAWAQYRLWLERAGYAGGDGRAQRQWAIWDDTQWIDRRGDSLKHYGEIQAQYHTAQNRLGEANTIRIIGDEYLKRTEWAGALRQYEDALRLYRRAGNHFEEANTRRAMGDVYFFLKRGREALDQYDEALKIYRDPNMRVPPRLSVAGTLKARGDVLQHLQRYSDAEDQYNEALTIYRAEGAPLSEAAVLVAMGNVLHVTARYEDARHRYEAALKLYRAENDRPGEAGVLMFIADQHQAAGESQAAREAYTQALDVYRAARDRVGEANALKALGDAHHAQRQPAEAEQMYADALSLYRAAGARLGEANTLLALGRSAGQQAQPEEALKHFEAARQTFEAVGHELGEAEALLAAGEQLLLMDRHDDAVRCFDDAAARYRRLGYLIGEAHTLRARGDERLARNAYHEALENYRLALNLYEQVDDRANQVETITRHAHALVALDRCSEAITAYTRAIGLAVDLPPEHREAHGWHGYLALTHGQFAQAAAHFEVAASRELSLNWQFGLGLAKFGQGLTESARSIIGAAWPQANRRERAEACRWLAHVLRLKPELREQAEKLGLTCEAG